MPNNKEYLGDGVYAEYHDYELILTTENGISVTNKIILEAEILNNLNLFLKRMFMERNRKNHE